MVLDWWNLSMNDSCGGDEDDDKEEENDDDDNDYDEDGKKGKDAPAS